MLRRCRVLRCFHNESPFLLSTYSGYSFHSEEARCPSSYCADHSLCNPSECLTHSGLSHLPCPHHLLHCLFPSSSLFTCITASLYFEHLHLLILLLVDTLSVVCLLQCHVSPRPHCEDMHLNAAVSLVLCL